MADLASVCTTREGAVLQLSSYDAELGCRFIDLKGESLPLEFNL